MTSRHRMDTFGLVAAAGLLMGAGPVRIDSALSGQVIDVDTRKPIEGAVLNLERQATCSCGFHCSIDHRLPRRETRTGTDGRFSIGGGVRAVPCPFATWSMWLRVIAPGYMTHSYQGTDLLLPRRRPEFFALDPIRFHAELDDYVHLARFPLETDKGSLWTAALSVAQHLPYQSVGRPGVFVSRPGAVFDRVATLQRPEWRRLLGWSVIAQDRNTGMLYGWTTKGTPEALPALPPGTSIRSGRHSDGRREATIAGPDRLYFAGDIHTALHVSAAQHWVPVAAQFGDVRAAIAWADWAITLEAGGKEVAVYDLHRWMDRYPPVRKPGEPPEILPGPRLAVADLLPGAQLPIECMAEVRWGGLPIVFITPDGDERAVYVLVGGSEKTPGDWRAARVPVLNGALRGEVTACAAGERALYVALKDRGIVKLSIGYESSGRGMQTALAAKVLGTAMLAGPAGPLTFTAMAAGNVDSHWEVLYAVAGDDAIYRFTSDLRPDQRIEMGVSATPGERPDR